MQEEGYTSTAERGSSFYDRQEVRNAAEREAAMFHALPGLIRHALDNAPFFAGHLAAIEPDSVTNREALAQLPLLRFDKLFSVQRERPPFGGLSATGTTRAARVFALPGPTYALEASRADYWRFARALYAAGFRRGELVHNCFAYHLTPLGSMVETGARALGCAVVPAGTAPVDLQISTIADLEPTAFAGPPSFLLELMSRGRDHGIEAGRGRKALVVGDLGERAARERLATEFGLDVFEAYAFMELGLVAYETAAHEGLVVDESVIVEIVAPETGAPVPMGETGEVVVTAFNPDYPLIRLATGHLSAVLPGQSPCGRTGMRLKGWQGRVELGRTPR